MYLDGLEIAGLGVGMVFLALVAILVATFGLRTAIERLEALQVKRGVTVPASEALPEVEQPVQEPSGAAEEAPSLEAPTAETMEDKAAKAAAIAVALFMTEEEESAEDEGGR